MKICSDTGCDRLKEYGLEWRTVYWLTSVLWYSFPELLSNEVTEHHQNTLQWRHNAPIGVSNYQLHDCLLNRLFKAQIKKDQSPASLALVRGLPRWQVNSPHKGPTTRKMFPFDDVIMREWANKQFITPINIIFYAISKDLCNRCGGGATLDYAMQHETRGQEKNIFLTSYILIHWSWYPQPVE